MKLFKLSLLLVLLLVSSSSIFAQSDKDHVNHFSIGVSAGVSADQWNLSSTTSTADGVTASSTSYLGYPRNLSGTYSFCTHWQLKVSPGVQRKKFDYRLDGLHFGQDFHGLGFNDSHIIYNIKATTFTVPVTVEYLFGTKQILPFIALGFAGEFIMKQTSDETIYYSDGTTDHGGSRDLLRKSNVAAVAGAGIYYRPEGMVSLSISPVFSYSLLHDSSNSNHYSFGAMAGIFYTPGR